jgi:C1A family cysteine protease
MTPKLGKGLGRKPDKADTRDRTIGAYQAAPLRETGAPLPSSTDVFAGLNLPVYDQGQLGSCTANAGVLYRRFLAQKFAKYSAPDQDLSRLFLYYQERVLDGDPNSDDGASVRDVFKVLTSLGVCPASDDRYNSALFASAAANDSAQDLAGAAVYKIGAYHRIPDVDTARSVLASGYAIELGFTVYASFESIGPDGMMPMPASGEQVIGGHAVVIHGYDDTMKGDGCFVVRNSWGADWGAKGDFFMQYAFLQDVNLSQFDMWIGHLGKPWHA